MVVPEAWFGPRSNSMMPAEKAAHWLAVQEGLTMDFDAGSRLWRIGFGLE